MFFRQSKIWKLFSSMRLAIWLLAVIVIFSLIGTLIPQNEDPAVYIERFGRAGYGFLLTTGLIAMYSSWWFILSLILLSLNLAVCLINRFSLKLRSLGPVAAHAGILVILTGALVGMAYGQKGFIKINKGEEVKSFISRDNKVTNLGFSIRLDDFIYSENISPKEKLLVYSSQAAAYCEMHDSPEPEKNLGLIAQIPAESGTEAKIADTGYVVKVLRYLPDFVMDTETKVASNRSASPNNPALEVELKDKDGKVNTFWLFARFPDTHQETGGVFKFVYDWAERQPKDFISKVTLLKDANVVMRKDIRVNEPLRFGGYGLFQASFDRDNLNWSGLQVVKDPGVPVVYSGFFLLTLGLILIFYVNPLTIRRK